jgi:hypothetical protein
VDARVKPAHDEENFPAISLNRHCERSEAIQTGRAAGKELDCFVASLLAMTMRTPRSHPIVMRGLDPRIHAFWSAQQDVDGRVKPGHDASMDVSITSFRTEP